MGMMRIAIVIAAGVALLPSDREQQDKLIARASDAANWVVTFCDRNGPTCTQAQGYWAQFVAKAEFGAKLAYDMMREQAEGGSVAAADEDAANAPPQQQRTAPASLERSGTLTPRDMQPAWRGAPKTKGSI